MGREGIKFIFLFIIFQRGGERVRERGWGGGRKRGRKGSR